MKDLFANINLLRVFFSSAKITSPQKIHVLQYVILSGLHGFFATFFMASHIHMTMVKDWKGDNYVTVDIIVTLPLKYPKY